MVNINIRRIKTRSIAIAAIILAAVSLASLTIVRDVNSTSRSSGSPGTGGDPAILSYGIVRIEHQGNMNSTTHGLTIRTFNSIGPFYLEQLQVTLNTAPFPGNFTIYYIDVNGHQTSFGGFGQTVIPANTFCFCYGEVIGVVPANWKISRDPMGNPAVVGNPDAFNIGIQIVLRLDSGSFSTGSDYNIAAMVAVPPNTAPGLSVSVF